MSNLPRLQFCMDNPYIPILTHSYPKFNTCPIEPCLLAGERGFYPKEKIWERILKFSDGPLDDLDLSQTAIVGPIIAACTVKNPLEQYFKSFYEYLQEYYPFFRKFTFLNKDQIVSDSQELSGVPIFKYDFDLQEKTQLSYDEDFYCIHLFVETSDELEFEEIVGKHLASIKKHYSNKIRCFKVKNIN